MKKLTAVLLLLSLLAPVAAFASAAPANISFKIIYGYAGHEYVHTVQLSPDDIMDSLLFIVRGFPGGENWNAPGRASSRLSDYYGGYVTIDLTKGWHKQKMPVIIVSPDYVGYLPKEPHKHAKPAPTAVPSNRKSFKNIDYITEYLFQVIANNRGIDFRLFEGDTRVAFLEKFDYNQDGNIRLTLTIWQQKDLKPVYTKEALDFLEALNVAEVVIKSKGNDKVYSLEELRAMI